MTSSIPYSDFPEFDASTAKIAALLFTINNNLVSLSKQVDSLSTQADPAGHETAKRRITELIKELTGLFETLWEASQAQARIVAGTGLSNGQAISSIDKREARPELSTAQSFTFNKLRREVQASLLQFTNLQKTYNRINLQLNEEARAAMAVTIESPQPEETQTLLVMEHEPLNAEELEYHQSLVEQREHEIAEIQHGVEALNGVFRDLGAIVAEQGTMVDNIESNLHAVATDTRSAGRELHQALRYQRRAGSRSCCLLLILGAVLGSVFLVIIV